MLHNGRQWNILFNYYCWESLLLCLVFFPDTFLHVSVSFPIMSLTLTLPDPTSESHLDLMEVIGVPLSPSVSLTSGYEGFQAYHFGPEANIGRLTKTFVPGSFPRDFAIIVTVSQKNIHLKLAVVHVLRFLHRLNLSFNFHSPTMLMSPIHSFITHLLFIALFCSMLKVWVFLVFAICAAAPCHAERRSPLCHHWCPSKGGETGPGPHSSTRWTPEHLTLLHRWWGGVPQPQSCFL